jgi:DNA-binding response OmpR family regulator
MDFESEPAAPGSRPLRVLVADDERDTVMTLGILLRSEGIDVRLARGGEEVALAVAEFRPDAVLLDLGMPDRSGFDVAHELRERYRERCPVLIAVTAHSSDSDKRKAAGSGFHHHVAKPYDPDALLALVASLKPRH